MDGCMKNAVVKIPVTSLYNMRSECKDNIAHSMALSLCGDIENALKYGSMVDFYFGQLSFINKLIEVYEEALKGVDTSY